MPRCGRSQERSKDHVPSMVLTWISQKPSPSSSRAYSPLLRTTVERDTSQADAVRGKRWTMTAETKQASGLGPGGRMSRQRKRDAVLRLLRGEDLETASRSLGVTAATLTGWRDTFLAAGEAGLVT